MHRIYGFRHDGAGHDFRLDLRYIRLSVVFPLGNAVHYPRFYSYTPFENSGKIMKHPY